MELSSKYIVIEGSEGVGKTCQTLLLEQFFVKNNIDVLRVREPTSFSEDFAHINRMIKNSEIGEMTRTFLLSAARAELFEKKINPALKEGKVVISDRSWVSFLAYQGVIRGQKIRFLKECIQMAMGGANTDLIIILTAPPEISWDRIRKRKSYKSDVIEKEGLEILKKLDKVYREFAHQLGAFEVDSSLPVKDVNLKIIEKITTKFR